MSRTQFTAEPGSHEITVTREVAAPPALVYRAFTEPELLAQWLGPRRLTMKVEHHDLRHGGSWRYLHIGPDGDEHAFRGCFHGEPSVEAGVTQTWEYEGTPGSVALEHASFEVVPGGTLLRLQSLHQSVEARDGHLAAGMQSGMDEGFARLDELMARVQA
jgi:uncharacterized protein YndB with AHSA1/START domain